MGENKIAKKHLRATYEEYERFRETYQKIVGSLKSDGELVGQNTHRDCGDGGPRMLTTLHCNGVTIYLNGVSIDAYAEWPARSELSINLASNDRGLLSKLVRKVKSIDKSLK